MKRRALLSAMTAVVAGGCLGFGQSTQPKLAWIWLQNERETRYEIDITVSDGDDLVFSDAVQLLPAESETTDFRLTNPVEGPGQYIVRATIEGETHEIDTTDSGDDDQNCIGVQFSLLTDGSVESGTKSMQEC